MLFKSQTQNYRLLLLTLFFLVINSIAGASGTWNVIKHVRGADWQDVFFLDESHGWAVGNYGAVISTENGGKDWKILQRKTEIFDLPKYEKEGWAVGEDGVILHTTDGGNSWTDFI